MVSVHTLYIIESNYHGTAMMTHHLPFTYNNHKYVFHEKVPIKQLHTAEPGDNAVIFTNVCWYKSVASNQKWIKYFSLIIDNNCEINLNSC